ncbi:MAG: SpoVA/SpoVAEb family sporulation membrane protein [Eubacteriales bacterium]
MEYQEYITQITPKNKLGIQMAKAFVVGGVICTIGQGIINYSKILGATEEEAAGWCTLLLILASVILTGCHVYSKIVAFGGAGALVPITGFANSVAAPAIEFKKEGQVYGIGTKIFTIAGPVILYGILCSWVLGIIYYVWNCLGGI